MSTLSNEAQAFEQAKAEANLGAADALQGEPMRCPHGYRIDSDQAAAICYAVSQRGLR